MKRVPSMQRHQDDEPDDDAEVAPETAEDHDHDIAEDRENGSNTLGYEHRSR